MKIKKASKKQFKAKYDIALKSLQILVAMVMGRKLLSTSLRNGNYVMLNPEGKQEEVHKDIVDSLFTKNYIYWTKDGYRQTMKGYDLAKKKVKDAGGKIYKKSFGIPTSVVACPSLDREE